MTNLSDLTPKSLGIPLMEVSYKVPDRATRQARRSDFNSNVRPRFIQHLVENCRDQLVAAGLTEHEIKVMADQGHVPHRYNVHHKLPIHGGGSNSFDNLILIDKASHQSIHDYIDPQIQTRDQYGTVVLIGKGQSRRIKLPSPPGNVFVPPGNLKQHIDRAARSFQDIGAEDEIMVPHERGSRLSGKWTSVHHSGPAYDSPSSSDNWRAQLQSVADKMKHDRLTAPQPGGRKP